MKYLKILITSEVPVEHETLKSGRDNDDRQYWGTMGVLGKICPKIPRNVIFARISLFLVPMALTCIKEHMKIEKGR